MLFQKKNEKFYCLYLLLFSNIQVMLCEISRVIVCMFVRQEIN